MKTFMIAGAASLIALGAINMPLAIAADPAPSNETTSGTAVPGATAATGTTPDTASASKTADSGKVPGEPEKGANSFTESQAQARISDAGYTSVGGLKKDGDGIWHGTAMKNGQQVGVWLDYAGNVGQS